MMSVPLRRSQAAIAEASSKPVPGPPADPIELRCRNGHEMTLGDLMCATCGAELADDLQLVSSFGEAPQTGFDVALPIPPVGTSEDVSNEATAEGTAGTAGPDPASAQPSHPTTIDGWQVDARGANVEGVYETFRVTRLEDGRKGILTLYWPDKEPDTAIYEAWPGIPRDHVPELLASGRSEGRTFDVTEDIGQTLKSLPAAGANADALKPIVRELAKVLRDFGERGLRHRNITPDCILVRTADPLDLVITGFGSARKSDFDLDVVAPLETTFYSAPESLSGTVSPASDWWSLGIILLERATQGACFTDINRQIFLMHAATVGVAVPKDLPDDIRALLRGLLIRNISERWGWPEVEAWLEGRSPPLPAEVDDAAAGGNRATISLGDATFDRAERFALAAAESTNWQEARYKLAAGEITTWAAELLPKQTLARLRRLVKREDLDADSQLMCALLLLNDQMPLAREGQLVTPAWLLENPASGYDLITGPVPDILDDWGRESWLVRLKARASAVREKAAQREIQLVEGDLRIFLLATSQARLKAQWETKRAVFPDAAHNYLAALIERNASSEIDLILLLSAEIGQFRARDTILDEAAALARRNGVRTFDTAAAAEWLDQPRRDLMKFVREQTGDLAQCGIPRLDEWVEQFRLERRLALERLLVVQAVPAEAWLAPPKQDYYQRLLDFFEKKITISLTRGPLVRMTIGRTTPRLDLAELGSARRPAEQALARIVSRSEGAFDFAPEVFADPDTTTEARLRRLDQVASLYKRDTGIDGLYLAFPFLLLNEAHDTRQPRTAPILLWPVKLEVATGVRGNVKLSFDANREDVRLNPALEAMLATDELARWRELTDDLLGQSDLTPADVLDAFATRVNVRARDLAALPPASARIKPSTRDVTTAAVIFNMDYAAQAIVDDIRRLKQRSTDGTALAHLLRMTPLAHDGFAETARSPEIERYFTAAIDPSQEAAVIASRQEPGVLLEGPPGTGKSQTIVNVITDAIGHGRSVLVVCQKQAALDVVRKRLEAQSLDERFVMVTDVNRDRQPILRQVREQAFRELGDRERHSGNAVRDRQQLAGLIESLEGDLDRHHRATLDVDPKLGLSYRELIGELIDIEKTDDAFIDAPLLRTALGRETPDTASRLASEAAPLAPLWRSAKYEESALAALQLFSPDPNMVEEFARSFVEFREAENDRAALVGETSAPFEVDDASATNAWIAEARMDFDHLDAEAFDRFARLIDLFQEELGGANKSIGQTLLDEATRISAELGRIGAEPSGGLQQRIADVSDSEFVAVYAFAERAQRAATFWSFLDFGRHSARAKARKFMERFAQPVTEEAYGTLFEALSFEHKLRPFRRSVIELRTTFEFDGMAAPPTRLTAVRMAASELSADLAEARRLAECVALCPRAGDALGVLRRSEREAFEGFLRELEAAAKRAAARERSRLKLDAMEPWFTEAWRTEAANAISGNCSRQADIDAIEAALPTLVPYQEFRRRIGAIPVEVTNLLASLRRYEQVLGEKLDAELPTVIRTTVLREARLAWKQAMEEREPLLLRSQSETATRVEELDQADQRMQDHNRYYLADKLDRSRVLGPQATWRRITRLTSHGGVPRSSIRDLVEQGRDSGLFELRPVWLMNPDVASRILPLSPGLFDVVIFDEASQMPVEYAVPTLFRGSIAVVSGDEKQMPPTAFFSSSAAQDDEADPTEGEQDDEALDELWNRQEIKDCPDLLQLARGPLPSRTLEVHYRSAYRELISFSNAAFYGNRLNVPVHHAEKVVARVKPIEVIRVDGTYEKRTNSTEADEAVRYLAKLWRKRERPSVGVVTFNKDQANLILEKIEAFAEENDTFRRALVEEQSRTRDHEDIGFFVKNVENVQGDERDLILFSTTFGLPPRGKFRRNFGVLGQSGGRRRLNVAVTRAREKVVLLTSIPVSEVSDMLATSRSPEIERDYIQGYLAYAEAVSDARFEIGRDICRRMVTQGRRSSRQVTQELDAFAASVRTYVQSLGLEAVTAASTDAFAVDLAIADPKTGLFALGIECDAPDHPILASARAREIWRRRVLSGTINKVHRIACVEWYAARGREQDRLRTAITAALGKGSFAA